MSYILGIDTGGTFTDGVLVDPAARTVYSTGKTFTTREDLSIGIRRCIRKLPQEQIDQTAMVCLSTTLATNAVVEGHSGRVGLLLMGRRIPQELPAAVCITLQGELDIKGRQRIPLDMKQVCEAVEQLRGEVDAVAVSGFASVRNPAHELAVKAAVQEQLHLPVVCAHELSQALGFYDRTVTAALNAGLIPCITELIRAVEAVLREFGLDRVPVMIVKGDGSLMQRGFALDRPIETVLSGPAASVVGGQFLTGAKDAIVLDMGGTTTDIAHIRNGKVSLNTAGAAVGGWRTQLRAVDVHTFGVGGDSRLAFDRMGRLTVGPQRVMPLCVAGTMNLELAEELSQYRAHVSRELIAEQYAECYRVLRRPEDAALTDAEQMVVHKLEDTVHSLFWLEEHCGMDAGKLGLDELVQRGILQRCGLTPTDLLHASGRLSRWDTAAAEAGVSIMAARQGKTAADFLQDAMQCTDRALASACLCAMLAEQQTEAPATQLAAFLLDQPADSALQLPMEVKPPVIALGAPVAAWLPRVCDQLGAELMIPEHAAVANAVGAAVGSVSVESRALIRHDQYHQGFVVHAPWGMEHFETLEQAEQYAVDRLEQYAADQAVRAGGHAVETTHRVKTVCTDCLGSMEKNFVEMQVYAVAVGAPAWSTESI